MLSLIDRLKNYRHKYEKRIEIIIFIGGFLFDALMVKEPDEFVAIIQQVIYLSVIAAILHYELLFHLHKWSPVGQFQKIWSYRELIQPFLLGTLLNVYSIFYIKSASFFSSVIFLLIMIAMILVNESPTVKKSGVSFKVGLFGICLFSFFSILFPILIGSVGWIPFSLSLFSSAGIFYAEFWLIKKKLGDLKASLQAILIPGLSVLIFFMIFYTMGWIPPVPLSVKDQGIYHLIEKKNGEYFLSTEKEWWRFWNSGDDLFKARVGDKIYFYVQVYSPTRFSDEVMIHWLWKNRKDAWENADKIPMKILGGRKEGFRGFTIKSNFQPGQWQVKVETLSGLEISRHYFQILTSEGTSPREFKIIQK
jgi:hypothetical protein